MQELRAEWNAASIQLAQEQKLWESKITRDRELAGPWLEKSRGPSVIDSVTAAKRAEFASKQSAIDTEFSTRLKGLQDQLQLNVPILESNLDLAKNDLAYWEAICEQQVIRAPHAGWVGEVMVSETEVTLKGNPLVEIWGHDARYVEGFIHENFTAELNSGQRVTLHSANDTENTAEATIVKLGNRIVEFPDRLRKAPDVRLWGKRDHHSVRGTKPLPDWRKSRDSSPMSIRVLRVLLWVLLPASLQAQSQQLVSFSEVLRTYRTDSLFQQLNTTRAWAEEQPWQGSRLREWEIQDRNQRI